MNTSLIPKPLSFKAPSVLVLERSQVLRSHPELLEACDEQQINLTRHYGKPTLSTGFFVYKESLGTLLNPHWLSLGISDEDSHEDVMVVVLPDNLSGIASQMARLQPSARNDIDYDLTNNSTYLYWTIQEGLDSQVTTIQMEKNNLIRNNIDHLFRYETHEWGWFPLLVICGEKVYVGGFVVDDELICNLQGLHMSINTYDPHDWYSGNDLEQARIAAKKLGKRPWVHQIWKKDGFPMLEVPFF